MASPYRWSAPVRNGAITPRRAPTEDAIPVWCEIALFGVVFVAVIFPCLVLLMLL
ncbi:MAG: hypothetical protein ACO3FT_04950 [Ilumatobacteraceae bacterium]|jgi:hypothetical protein